MNVLNPSRKLPAKIPPLTTDLLLLADGRLLIRNLTPVFAKILEDLDLGGPAASSRVSRITIHGESFTSP
jgi:hypothetical protein